MKFNGTRQIVTILAVLLVSVTGSFLVMNRVSPSNAADIPTAGFVSQSVCGANGKAVCIEGSIGPGGGVIYFVDYANRFPTFTYLEAAPAGWADPNKLSDPELNWCSDTTHRIESSRNNWTSRKVGIGRENTLIMIADCKSGAANSIDLYNKSHRSKDTDWFLPSLGEIALMAANLQGLGDLIASDYWSSSEFSDVGGWAQSISHGYQGSATKDTTFYVRPIRSF
jgi:hypothetical protein